MMTQRRWTAVLIAAGLILGACEDSDGDGGYLGRDTVTSLPDGDGVGSDASGTYDIELYTTNCTGRCPVIDYGWFTLTLCDVGDIDNETVTVTQTDGHLQVDGESNLLTSRMIGGINTDGSFDVGGYSTQEGGQVDITSRVEGIFHTDGSITGTAQAHGQGSLEGESINCTATYEVTGSRQ